MPGQALFHARQFDVRGRIVEDVILAREPLEQRADRRRADMLAARRERLAIRLAVEEQMALIPLQDRFADLLRARQPALVRPAYEQAQRILAILHGALRVIFLPLPPAEPEHMIVKAVGIAREIGRANV